MLFAEELLGLAYLGALKMASFGGDFVEGGGDDRQRRQIVRVTVTLDNLRGNIRRLQTQARTNFFLEFRARCANVPTAPENLPTRISSAACWKRSISRCTSEYQFASLKPNVIGSAWMPWVRPIWACL